MSEIQGKPVYGICGCKEKVQVLSVDQAVDLIQQMTANGFQVPSDYIPKTCVNGIVEQNTKREVKLWVGTQAEYDALSDTSNLFAIISDDPTKKEIEDTLKEHGINLDNLNKNVSQILEGVTYVPNATNSTKAASLNDSSSETDKIVLTLNNNGTTKTIAFIY